MCTLSSFIDRRNDCTKYCLHGTADGGKSCCYPWLVCHDIKSAMHCLLRLAPTMINHLTSRIFFSEDRCLKGCNVSFAVSQIENCLELNFRYVDYQTLAHLSYSSCVYWISAHATRVQHFLSVRESISASTVIIFLQGNYKFQISYLIHQAHRLVL